MAEDITPNVNRINEILQRTIEAIENSKEEIIEIVEQARNNVKIAEKELEEIKEQVEKVIKEVDELEIKEKKSRIYLANVNKNFNIYSEKDLKDAYDKANEIRIQLLLKREMEKNLINKRREQELILKSAFEVYEKAKKAWKSVSVVNEYLNGNLDEILFTVDNLNRKQALIIRMIEVQEEERHKLAMDIHDGPAQSLANLVVKAEVCERLMDIDKERAKNELLNLKTLIRAVLGDIRKTIYDLRPMSLDDLGLIPTLKRYISNFNEYTGIKVEFKVIGQPVTLNSSIEITIFRVIQEALNNINKHSKATESKITIEFTPTRLNLSIVDNGIGFDYGEISNSDNARMEGYGLVNMRERIELIGGNFKVKSIPGKGTRISFYILLAEEEN